MFKLTVTQQNLLTGASTREDGAACIPKKMNKVLASKLGAGLVSAKLMRETKAKPGMPIWRKGEDGDALSLVITRTGRDAIASFTQPSIPTSKPTIDAEKAKPKSALLKPNIASSSIKAEDNSSKGFAAKPVALSTPRSGSKQALVIDMLLRDEGASLDALVEATGWLPHTTRAALTGLRKRGFAIGRQRREGGGASVWRIVETLNKAA